MATSKNTSQKQDKSAKSASGPSQGRGTGNSAANPAMVQVTDEQRRQMIAVVAYYRAERRGFCERCELEDWLAAEAELSRQMQGPTDS